MLLVLLAAAMAAELEVPDPARWEAAARLHGLELGSVGKSPGAVVRSTPTGWNLEVMREGEAPRRVRVEEPHSEADRERIVALAASMLRSSALPAVELPPPVESPEPVQPPSEVVEVEAPPPRYRFALVAGPALRDPAYPGAAAWLRGAAGIGPAWLGAAVGAQRSGLGDERSLSELGVRATLAVPVQIMWLEAQAGWTLHSFRADTFRTAHTVGSLGLGATVELLPARLLGPTIGLVIERDLATTVLYEGVSDPTTLPPTSARLELGVRWGDGMGRSR